MPALQNAAKLFRDLYAVVQYDRCKHVSATGKNMQQELQLVIGTISVERRQQVSLLLRLLLPVPSFTSVTYVLIYFINFVLMMSSQH